MADLSQFLNSGGKRSRVVSRTVIGVGSGDSPVTITPAADEYVIYIPANFSVGELSTSRITLTNVDLQGNTGGEAIHFGLGEAVTITGIETEPSVGIVLIYEEY